jgi:hypothetical protein
LREPWFKRHPAAAMAVGASLFVAVFVLRVAARDDPGSGVTTLFLLPIALFAFGWGVRGGLIAGLAAIVLTYAWVVVDDVELSALGWVARFVPPLLVGGLLGHAADRIGQAHEVRRAHDVAVVRHRQAVELNDTLIQGMAAAKWSLEAGRTEAGLAGLTDALEKGHRMVSELLREADMGLDGHRGDLDDPTPSR